MAIVTVAIFTDKYIRDFELPAKSRKLVFDEHRDAPRGFGLRVTPKGKKSFVLRYNAEGKDRLLTIGEHPIWTLTSARKAAQDYKRDIDGGSDVLEQRRIQRAELTLAEVIEQYCSTRSDKLKSGAPIRGAFRLHVIPQLGSTKITQVRRRDIIRLLEPLANKKQRTAGKVLGHIKQVFAWAEDREIIEANPVATLTKSKISHDLVAVARTRVLTDDEIITLWQCKPNGMSRTTWLALCFILATGQRPGEVAQAECREIHGKTWTIPKAHRGKTDDDHDVPLTDTALRIIEQAGGNRYLFEGRGGQPIQAMALPKAVSRCCRALGNDPANRWRPHDLRRTMRTGLAAAKVPEEIAERVIGHKRQGIVAVYDQHRYAAEKRTAMEAWERRLLRIVNGVSDSNVVSIAGARA